MTQPTPPTNTEISELATVIKLHTNQIKESGERTEALITAVQREAAAREAKVQRLEEQALALKDQTAELKQSNKRMATYGKILLVGLLVNILALLLMAFLLFQFNKDSKERSKQAADQRQAQLTTTQQLGDVARVTGRCAVTSHGNVSVYDACIKAGK